MPYMAWWMRRNSRFNCSSLHPFGVWAMRAFVCSDWSLLLGFYLVMQAERDREIERKRYGKVNGIAYTHPCDCQLGLLVSVLGNVAANRFECLLYPASNLPSYKPCISRYLTHTHLSPCVHRMHICRAPSAGTEWCTKRAFLAQFALFTRIHLWAR